MGSFAWIEHGDGRGVIVADQPTIDLFIAYNFFPDVTFVDVTRMRPMPQIGWTYATGRDPRFRPPPPGEGWWWDDIHGEWAPPAEPDPEPEPEPQPEDPGTPTPPATPPRRRTRWQPDLTAC